MITSVMADLMMKSIPSFRNPPGGGRPCLAY